MWETINQLDGYSHTIHGKGDKIIRKIFNFIDNRIANPNYTEIALFFLTPDKDLEVG